MPLSDLQETSSCALIDNSHISYKKSGSGPPLVFFHGWIGNEDTFAPCHSAFAHHYTVYRPAWPGYGKSPPLSDFSIEDLVEIGRRFILEMDRRPVTLVGNCLGGIIAMELLRRHPEIVERLVLIEMYDFIPWYLHLLLIPHLNVLLYRLLLNSAAGFRFLNSLLTIRYTGDGKGMGYVEEGFQRTPASTAIDFLKAVKRFEKKYRPLYREQYQTDVATIYVEGGRNFKPISAFRESVHKYFRNLIIVSIPESLHLPIAEQPNLFSARVLPQLGHSLIS
ncbi:MAG: alpha/beta hydrolase [Syntrophales bacterium]|nr:alpha/beta hydrolase [Syntrophales bacterium]